MNFHQKWNSRQASFMLRERLDRAVDVFLNGTPGLNEDGIDNSFEIGLGSESSQDSFDGVEFVVISGAGA